MALPAPALVLRLSTAGALVGLGRLSGVLQPATEAGVWLGLGVVLAYAVAWLSPAGALAKGAAVGALAAVWAGILGSFAGWDPLSSAAAVPPIALGFGFLAWVASQVLHSERAGPGEEG